MGIMRDILDSMVPDPLAEGVQDVGRGALDIAGQAWNTLPSPVQGRIGDVAGVVGGALDMPRGAVATGIGTADYWAAELRHKVGLEDEADMQNIRDAYERGGGREVWEDEIVGEMPMWQRGLLDVAIDPLTYAGAGIMGNVGRGLSGAGKVIGAADDVGTGMRAVGAGLRGVGKATEISGSVLGSPDKYIFDPAMRVAGRGIKKTVVNPTAAVGRSVATHSPEVIRRPLSSLSERARERTLAKINHWKELTPEAQLNQKVNRVSRAVTNLFAPSDPSRPGLPRQTAVANDIDPDAPIPEQLGAFTAVQPQNAYAVANRRGSSTPLQDLPEYRAEMRVRQMRNDSYTSKVARDILDETGPVAGLVDGKRGLFAQARDIITRINEKSAAAGIVPGQPGGPMATVTQHETPYGIIASYASREEREVLARSAQKMILAAAPSQNSPALRGLKFAVRDLQNVQKQFLRENPAAGPLWPDIYRRAKEMIESETGMKMPAVSFAGRNPLGGGLKMADVTDGEVESYAVNFAAAIVQVLRRGGVASEFEPNGAFFDPEEGAEGLRRMAREGVSSESGLQLATFDEFRSEFEREFGSVADEVANELYELGIERFRTDMITNINGIQLKGKKLNEAIDKGKSRFSRRSATRGANGEFFSKHGMTVNEEGLNILMKSGVLGENFYEEGIKDLADMIESPEQLDLFIQLVAATSPNTKVKDNTEKAISAFVAIISNPKEVRDQVLLESGFSPDQVASLADSKYVIQEPFGTHRSGIREALRGDDLGTQKIHSFEESFRGAAQQIAYEDWFQSDIFRNTSMMTPEDQAYIAQEVIESMRQSRGASTIDIWSSRAHKVDEKGLSPDVYQTQSAALKVASNRSFDQSLATPGVEKRTPEQYQAGTWFGEKKNWGYDPENPDPGNVEVARNILQEGDAATFLEMAPQRIRKQVRDTIANAEEMVATVMDRARVQGATYWNPSLKQDKLPSSALDGSKLKKENEILLIEHDVVPTGSGSDLESSLVKDLVLFKYKMDEAFDPTWANMRVLVDNVRPDGAMKLQVYWYPGASVPDDVIRRYRKRVAREMKYASSTNDEFKVAARITEGVQKMDEGWKASTKDRTNRPRTSNTVANNVDEMIDRLGRDGSFDGATYKQDANGRWREVNGIVDRDGNAMFPVAIASAGDTGLLRFANADGTPGNTDVYRNQGKEAGKEFVERMEPVINGPYEDLLYMGGFKAGDNFPGEASLDMTIGARSLEEALEIGELTNQISVWDPSINDSVPVPGGLKNSDSPVKTPEQAEQLLDIIEDARREGRSIIEVARERGWPDGGVLIADGATPGSVGLTPYPAPSQAADAFLDIYDRRISPHAQRVKRALLGDGDMTDVQRRSTEEYQEALRMNIGELDDKVMAENTPYWLSDEENELLYGTTFEDGETIGGYAERLIETMGVENQILNQMGITWSDGMSLKAKKALTDDEYIQEIIERWHEVGLKPGFDERATVAEAVQRRLVKESGIDVSKRTTYDKVKSIWGEIALASPRYVLANISTNILDSMISGHWNFNASRELADMFRYAAADMAGDPIGKIAMNTKYGEIMVKYGIGDTPELFGLGARSSIGTVKRGSQFRKVAEKLKLGWTAKGVEAPLAFAQGVDNVRRVAVFEDAMEESFERNRVDLLAKLDAQLQKAISDKPDLEAIMGRDMLPSYDPVFLKGYYKKLGIDDGRAEAMARSVANVRNTAINDGLKEADRIFLNYHKTNADEAISKVIPFHFWASRKVRYYAEEAYRNPVVAANYFRAQAGIERVQDDPGLSARQKGFLRLMGGPTGFTLMMNPDALMGVIKASGLNDTYTPEGETEVGAIIQKLKKNGIGLYPWIDGAINMMGVYGDTFEPDMLGIRHRGLVGSVVNWMRAEGMFGEGAKDPGADPYAEFNQEAREVLSKWASSFAPEWLTSPVEATAGGPPSAASLEHVIQSRIIAENPGITNQELIALMNDPDSDAYQSAFQDAARAGVIQQVLSFSTPFQWRVEENTKDVRSAAKELVNKEADKLGILPHEVTDGVMDAEFRANYKNKTGEDFSVKEWQHKDLQSDLARATPEGRQFVVYENEYRNIGGKLGQMVMDDYNAYRSGAKAPPGYRGSNILNETPEMREFLANRWLTQSGNKKVYDDTLALRRSYREMHPEFNQFKDWQGQMFDLQSLHGGTLAEYRRQVARQNPSAARYFADQIEWLQERGVPADQMEAELDRVTINSNAYFAIAGMPKTQFDPSRGVGSAGTGDPLQEMTAPYMQGGYPQMPETFPEPGQTGNWTDILAQYAR